MGAPQTALTSNNGERPQTIDVGAYAGARERPGAGLMRLSPNTALIT
jgi:hypothetical protein